MANSILEKMEITTLLLVRTLLFFKCIVACAAAADTPTSLDEVGEFFTRTGPSLKEWRANTNFDNVENWQGLIGHENCSKNIYSFPPWYDQENVVTLPDMFIGQQIILPVNGHFVFREGITKFLSPAGGDTTQQQDTCSGREVKFSRASPAEWFDPDKWSYSQIQGDNESRRGSLLNAKTLSSKAIAHVERVPCQYDSVRFPENSSFNLKISANVTIAKFYFGDKVQSHVDMVAVMNSSLGKLQFRKAPEAIFSITDNRANNANNNNGGNSSLFCEEDKEKGDSDLCICSNYMDRETRQRICSLANCDSDLEDGEDNCPNPITPHGFCCPICGFHVKVRHSGNLRLNPLFSKLKAEVGRQNLRGKLQAHLARYKGRAAHLVLVPSATSAPITTEALQQISSLVQRFESILKQESEVIEVTVIESWGGLYPSGGSSDRLAGSSLGAGAISLLVVLCIVAVLGGIALAIFIWNKKSGYPPLTLSSVTASLPRMSDIRIPIVPGAGRRSSTLSSSLQSFGFARFTNERVSTITIGQAPRSDEGEGGSGGSSKLQKSSSIRRAEEVDDQVPVSEKVIDANSGAYGFSNVTYDLVAGVNENNEASNLKLGKDDTLNINDEKPREKMEIPSLQIPEIKIKESDEPPIIQERVHETKGSSTLSVPSTSKGKGDSKRKEDGKGKLPGFVASRIAKAYQKLDDEPQPEITQNNDTRTSTLSGVDEIDGNQVKEPAQAEDNDTSQEESVEVVGSVETLVSFLEE